jgi:hypothetical protein
MGLEPVQRFIASYEAHPAGTEHRLLVVLGGPGGDLTPWRRAFAGLAHDELEVGRGI